jgi:hypothetical protein
LKSRASLRETVNAARAIRLALFGPRHAAAPLVPIAPCGCGHMHVRTSWAIPPQARWGPEAPAGTLSVSYTTIRVRKCDACACKRYVPAWARQLRLRVWVGGNRTVRRKASL